MPTFSNAIVEIKSSITTNSGLLVNYGSIGGIPTYPLTVSKTDNGTNNSVMAHGKIIAGEYGTYSDARIKNITGISNSTQDLETINAFHVTDYTMKDKVKYGNKPIKKIIAQKVEKVYPQVVSKHNDFIPNVYQVTNKIEKKEGGYVLNFANKHNISKTKKKLRILSAEEKGMEVFEVINVGSD